MSNALREKLLRFEQLMNQEYGLETKALIEALFLQTSILNERLFSIELALQGKTPRHGLTDPELPPSSSRNNRHTMNTILKRDPAVEQRDIIERLQVFPSIDIDAEIARRTAFLIDAMTQAGRYTLILGISGGVDSLTAGFLAQKAAMEARAQGHAAAQFIAVRLPYGEQHDEPDAQQSLRTINPDVVITVDIKPASDAMLSSLAMDALNKTTDSDKDFILGNIKARQRMIAQYAIAGNEQGLVIGTDHAAEALTGFFTKYGDGGSDVLPLSGLTKRQVRSIAKHFGAPDTLVGKIPTADLETLTPMKPDEDALGLTYAEIDDFLEGKQIDDRKAALIRKRFEETEHKRNTPIAPNWEKRRP
jgi:NAD+ synthase